MTTSLVDIFTLPQSGPWRPTDEVGYTRCVVSSVVVLTVSADVYVPDVVCAAVRARGADAVRVDSDDFASAAFAVSVDDADEFAVVVDQQPLRASRIWARRRWPGTRSAVVDEHQAGAAAQARTLFHAWLRARGGDVVNAVDAEDRAEDKVLQLRIARELGFTVPRTLISNDPARVRAFCADVTGAGGVVVTKLLAPLTASFSSNDGFFYTSVVDEHDVAHVDDVVHAPQIFQRRVDKVTELRVQVIGDHVFCGALDADADDWRIQKSGTWTPQTLSTATELRCLRLCRALGLVTGAVDLVVDSDGVEHFLEINPAGEWGFLQRDCGLPIAEALAAVLVDKHAFSLP